jgi:hypothetical protein
MEGESLTDRLQRLQALAVQIATSIQPQVEGAGIGSSGVQAATRPNCPGFFCGAYNCTPPFNCSVYHCGGAQFTVGRAIGF